ncbi:deoxyribonuclease-1-like [Littorina saxatilis]|uniref:Deoxyribonuclease n=1 Tax=Littorina saxatilis TaxID=31220 RepID=A0AAN9GB42_9CAEN
MRATVLLWSVVCVTWSAAWALKLGSFNIQVFGERKAADKFVMSYLAKILAGYDIVLIMEIRDKTDDSIYKLIRLIKTQENVEMVMKLSDREGRTDSKEQYAYLYRADRGISAIDVYKDNSQSWWKLFERPPYIVRFCSDKAEVGDFTLVGLHSKPLSAVQELQALPQVYNSVSKDWNTTNIVILGDLNADCHYVSKNKWKVIPIRNDKRFWWPIVEGEDTTVESNCAYDRFIIGGKALKNAVVTKSPGPYYYNITYGLKHQQTLEISDHFPIQLQMQQNKNKGRRTSQCSGRATRHRG